MKRTASIVFALTLAAGALVGCSKDKATDTATDTTTASADSLAADSLAAETSPTETVADTAAAAPDTAAATPDTAAASVAELLKAEKLMFVSDTPGLLRDKTDEQSLISSADEAECRRLMATGVIGGGMIPKIEAGLASLRAGVSKVHLIDGRVRHSLLLEIYTDRGVGTQIVA